MGRLAVVVIVILALIVLAGGLFLAFWQPPVPAAPVEKVLLNARFPK